MIRERKIKSEREKERKNVLCGQMINGIVKFYGKYLLNPQR